MAGYNYRKIKNAVTKDVKSACYSRNNKFKAAVWEYHVLPVAEHSQRLGRKLGADLEILELASLLHDYACIVNADYYNEHHEHGARLAGNLLKKYGCPEEMIERIQDCILCHRGRVVIRKKSLEAKILASADAMSHITEPIDMLYLTYNVHHKEMREGAAWLKAKLERSWKKIMPEGKALVRKEYQDFIKILNKTIKKL